MDKTVLHHSSFIYTIWYVNKSSYFSSAYFVHAKYIYNSVDSVILSMLSIVNDQHLFYSCYCQQYLIFIFKWLLQNLRL